VLTPKNFEPTDSKEAENSPNSRKERETEQLGL
jgi:hypothetical protein